MGYVAVGTAWGMKKQTAFGSGATVDKWIPFISETITKKYDVLEITDSQSRYKRNNEPLGRLTVEGDVDTYVEVTNVGYPLYFLMGSAAVSTGSPVAGTHTHTFVTADEVPYFTSEFKYGTVTDSKGKRAYDCKMKSATFDFADDALTVTWGIHGADYSGNITSTSITNPTGRKFTYKDLKVDTLPGITVTYNGTDYTGLKIKNAQLSVDNGLITDDYYQGSQKVQQIDAGRLQVNGSLELIFDNSADLVDWLDGDDEGSIEIRYEGDIITGTTKETLKFTVPHAWVTSHSIPMTNNEVIVRKVEFEAFYDPNAATKGLTITLINAQATAYSA